MASCCGTVIAKNQDLKKPEQGEGKMETAEGAAEKTEEVGNLQLAQEIGGNIGSEDSATEESSRTCWTYWTWIS